MYNIFLMWKNTRMIVLTAVCAAIYAATLIAFKTAIPLIPGITEVRVAGVFPMAFGILFGPAGAWGLGFGNLIGDIFGGTLTPSSVAGFFGNFLLGYLPYTMWTNLVPLCEKSYDWKVKSLRSWTGYILINLISSAACAIVIAVVVDALGVVPYAVLSKIITLNDGVGGMIGVILLIAVYDVVKGPLNLRWTDVVTPDEQRKGIAPVVGAWIVTLGAVAGIIGNTLFPGISVNVIGWCSVAVIFAGCLLL